MQDEQIMQDTANFRVSVHEPEDAAGPLVFKFVPREAKSRNGSSALAVLALPFLVTVRQDPGGLQFDWSSSPEIQDAMRAEIEEEIAARMRERTAWIERVNDLISEVEGWAKELDWATRRVSKKLDDSRIGKHRVPALLMQADTCRVLLEPLGRSSIGTEGVVDLYLMPAYDDIARLTYDHGGWNLHYLSEIESTSPTNPETLPFTKETFGRVIEEMRRHAA